MPKTIAVMALTFMIQAVVIPHGVAKPKAEYDPFADKTSIEISSPKWAKGGPTPFIEATVSFKGRIYPPEETISLGFVARELCPVSGFIVDGERIPGKLDNPYQLFELHPNLGLHFNYNAFTLEQVKTIAFGNVVQYKACEDVVTVNQEDKRYLQTFVSLFK